MRYISIFFIIILFLINTAQLYAADALTTKQQLDRMMEEVKDLNKAVFSEKFDKSKLNSNNNNGDTNKFSSIDLRIYDLEKDIKNLTLQLEEILFKLDDFAYLINSFETKLSGNPELNQENSKNLNIEINQGDLSDIKEENILGKLVISNGGENSEEITDKNTINENEATKQKQELKKLSPEELLQFALDQMMKKNYSDSKTILQSFIEDHSDNKLSGSAHFWLGKIYLFESNFRKAAIVFGEGVQKFPNSIKAAEMYYELSKSLKEMNKFSEACKTLDLLNEFYEDNKYTKDPEKIRDDLNCESLS